ncbi:MAG: FGGY-family carbohydrate kinase [Akkermansiaceae bacterium]
MQHYIGIDIGTGSARAGLFDAQGSALAKAVEPIKTGRPSADFAEQSSSDIWRAVCACVRQVMRASAIPAETVRGIGFDATCSLVVVDGAGSPVTISPTGDDDWNIIVWMDHRAVEQTARVNACGAFSVFDYVGGSISPEMQIPKLLWLKENLPATWERAAHFFDLPDYLTFRATGSLSRSLCSTTCKWTYLAHEAGAGGAGWHDGFFHAAGLGDLAAEQFRRIGQVVLPMGRPVGAGLTAGAAGELGLMPGTPVGASIIDAHAGGIGMLGMEIDGEEVDFDRRLALIGGTSSCHMAVSAAARPMHGVWGPYYSAMVPGLWLNEGGQSATGALIDHIIHSHAAHAEAEANAKSQALDIYAFLNHRAMELAGSQPVHLLTAGLHLNPDFHGNRSPRANPNLRGMISGLNLGAGLDDLVRLYLATIQAVAYGTRHIIETMNAAGYQIDTLLCCGGGTKNPVFLKQHADITGCRLILPEEADSVLLGSAMLGSVAAGAHASVADAMKSMARPASTLSPDPSTTLFHRAKYAVFHRLHDDQIAYQNIMRAGL